MKLYVQKVGQAVEEVSLTGSTQISATPGTRLFVEANDGTITHMSRSGSQLVVNTTDGKVINVDNFFGSADQGMSSLTIENTAASGLPEKQIVLGDERLYADGSEVVAYTPEQLKDVISGWDYYEMRGEEAAAAGSDDNTGLFVALGLGAATIAGLIALANNDDDNGHSSSSVTPTPDPDPTPDPTPSNLTDPTLVTLNRSNGSSLSGTSDAHNTTVYIDINNDGTHDYTTTTDANGNWSFPSPTAIPDGSTVSIWVLDSKGGKIEVSTVIDATAPDFISMTISQDLAVITGKTEAGAVVKLDLNGDGVAEYTIKADDSGNYKFTLENGASLIPGTSVISLADDLDNVSHITIPVATKATVLGMSDGTQVMDLSNTTEITSPTLHGLGTPGAIVQVMDGNTVIGTTTVGTDSNWSITATNLPVGKHSFDVETIINTPVTGPSKENAVNITFEQKPYDMSVIVADIREVEIDNSIDAPISITRALPNGGYLVAYPQAEAAGSKFYDVKVKIFDASGQMVSELTLGDKNVADGYSRDSAKAYLSNFDVAVSPVDGAITVLYSRNENPSSYTGNDVVYQRFSADGAEITAGPQIVASSGDIGGMNGLLTGLLPDGLANLITNTLSGIVNPIADFMTSALKTIDFLNILPDTDFKALVDLFVNGLTNRIYTAMFGQGLLSSSIVQMEDGSVVFTGTRFTEPLDLENMVNNADISGFIKEFTDALGLKGIPIIGSVIDFITEGVLNLLVKPIEGLADSVLTWFDLNAFEAGANLYSVRYDKDANGNLVKVSENTESPHDFSLGGFFTENGYITTSNGAFDKAVNWIFGKNPTSDSEGLVGADLGGGQYAVIWQQAGKDWSLDQLLKNPVDLKISVVDFGTGKIVLDGATLNTGAPKGSADVSPKIITLPDGTFAVSWVRVTGSDMGDVLVQRFQLQNGKLLALDAQPIVVNSTTDGAQGVIAGSLIGANDITVLENGNYVVSWASATTQGESHVISRVFDMSGQAITEEIIVDKGVEDPGVCSLPSVVALAGGGFAVTWSEVSDTGGNLYSRTYNDDGSIRGTGESADVSNSGHYVKGTTESAVGTNGDDVIDGTNGVTNVVANDGNDRIIVMSDGFQSIDGGKGFDTVVFEDKSATTIDSATLNKLHNIEQIDLNSTSALTLDVKYDDLIKMNDDKHLFVTGTAEDKVDLDLTSWTNVATANKSGVQYNLYVYDKDEDAQVWVQNTIAVI
ncbi:Ig-like domain-containing protein [Limnobaculum parvum]|nr:Ig-like domain-containing protein [Limnobaculum parvum]